MSKILTVFNYFQMFILHQTLYYIVYIIFACVHCSMTLVTLCHQILHLRVSPHLFNLQKYTFKNKQYELLCIIIELF